MRSFSDHVGMSREKLAFLVDTCSSPLKSIIPISAWVGFELNILRVTLAQMHEEFPEFSLFAENDLYSVLLSILQYRFYPFYVICFMLIITWFEKDFGVMWRSENRAATQGKVMRDGAAVPEWVGEVKFLEEYGVTNEERGLWINAVVPIVFTSGLMMAGTAMTGIAQCRAHDIELSFSSIISMSDIFS
jgi:Na+/H+ antiporter NhaC